MHRSKLGAILIDCDEASYERGLEFWSKALGRDRDPDQEPDDRYTNLVDAPGQVRVSLQKVEQASSFHLDIETDDVEAEVARLEKLGAVRKYKVRTWWVMRAPTGHDFCVIRPQSERFATEPASTWSE